MEFHMKNFVNIKGIYTNRIGISTGNGGCIYEYMANDKNINRSKITI